MKEDPVDKPFKKWRGILVGNLFFGYCLYYVTRKSCTYSLPLLLEDDSLSLTNEVVGLMFSTQMLAYSIGKFVCGILSDKYSCKLMFSIGLFLSGICNVLFALCSYNYQFMVLWAINGFFQGCGWAPIAILVKRWYLQTEIGKVWSFMSATMNLSSSVIPLLMVTLSSIFNWRMSFCFLGILACVFSFITFTFVIDYPDEVTCERRDSYCGASNSKQTSNNDQMTLDEFIYILSNKFLCLVSLSYLLWTGVKNGLEDWLLVYLTREKAFSIYQASFSMMYFQFGGLASCLSSGILSDILMAKFQTKMRSSPRFPVVIFCSTFILLWLYLLQSHFVTSYIIINVTCFFLGLCCYGPHTLYGLLVLENAPPGLSGTAHGIAGTASTIGSVFAGYPLSYLIDNFGWKIVFLVLAFIAVINSSLLFLCTTFACKIESKKKED